MPEGTRYRPVGCALHPGPVFAEAVTNPKTLKTIVIGAGFSGLSAACYLAQAGHEVTVLEKNAALGGRARELVRDGFRFDMGPTFYWMPDIVERFFSDFGHSSAEYYALMRLDPSYAIRFRDGGNLDLPAGSQAVEALFERLEPGSGRFLRNFLRSAGYNYRVATQKVIYRPGRSPLELVMPETLARLPQFLLTLGGAIRRGVRDERLRRVLEFPALFLGAKAGQTPSFYRFMNYADMELGTWHIRGGMARLVDAMRRLAESLGARILTGRPVREIVVGSNRVRGVRTPEEFFAADCVVSGADYHHTETLLPARCRNYTQRYWKHKIFAPSALLYYVAFDTRIDGVRHHTLFFDAPFEAHADRIYNTPGWPDRPLFYASFPSLSDPTCCPAGCDTAVVLIPAAAGLEEPTGIRERYFGQVVERLEGMAGKPLRGHIRFCQSYGPSDFASDYNACRGNAYGLANTLAQTAFLRPKICNRHLRNLFYTGQLTVPGPGVPAALVSGKVAAGCVLSRFAGENRFKHFDYGSALR